MALLPKSSAKASGSPDSISPSSIVMYEHQNISYLACVLEYRRKYQLLNERERETELAANRLHCLPGKVPAEHTSTKDRSAYLLELHERCREQAKKFSVEELWSFVAEDPRDFTCEELVELYFGKNELESHIVLRIALLADAVFFKRKKESFRPREADIVEQLKKAEAVKKRKLQAQEQVVSAVQKRLDDPSFEFSEDIAVSMQLLTQFASGYSFSDNARNNEAKELINLIKDRLDWTLSGPREKQAFFILKKLGVLSSRSNPVFLRHGAQLKFSEDVLADADTRIPPGSVADYQDERLDLTHLPAITVDDTSTRDMDDALTLEHTDSGYRLGVHISDVASMIPAESKTDLAGRERATSIYCPDRTVHMFPEVISERALSLVAGEARPCISYLFNLNSNFEIQNWEIKTSVINVARRITYTEADEALESGSDPLLQDLYNIAMNREAERIANGGFKVHKRDIHILFDGEDKPLRQVEIDENSPARNTIGEMMILVNEISAAYAIEHSLPVSFRSQEPPHEMPDPVALGIPPGPAADYVMRSGLKPSSTGFTPAPHSMLGLKHYIQVSSPIRRYIDLLNQRQILSHLQTGKAFYTQAEYEAILPFLDHGQQIAGGVSKDSRRYWFLRFLRQRLKQSDKIKCVVLRTDLKTPLVELDEIFFPTLVKFSHDVKPGDEYELLIKRVEPYFEDLYLEKV